MKIARLTVGCILALLVACAGTTPKAGPTPGSTTSSTQTPSPGHSVASILYQTIPVDTPEASDQIDLWRYDVDSDSVARLTNDGKRVIESSPRFHGERITFIADRDRLVELDPATGTRRTILTADDTILAYAWSPNGRRAAYIDVNYERDSMHHLRIHDAVTGRATLLKSLGTPPGRGTHDDDEVSIDWNTAGTQLLINDTHLDTVAMVRVLTVENGEDVVAPLKKATNAIFSEDEHSFIVRLIPDSGERRWIRVDLTSGSRTALRIPATNYHATLSPDGRRIALLRLGARDGEFVVDVHDLSSGDRLTSVSGYRDPLWLSEGELAATRVGECPKDATDCEYYGWRGLGARRIALSGSSTPIKLGTTLWDGSRVDVALS